MNESQNQKPQSLVRIAKNLMLDMVPSYANKLFYSLGFLSMTSLMVLIVSGIVLVLNGPDWWLTKPLGVYVRSVHLWSAQAFIFFILLHLLIVFLTSAYKAPRQLTWGIGACMFFLAFVEAEFGYGLRNDFSSQWRALQASDLYNGSGLGIIINNLNYAQIYGIHIIIIPFAILGLLTAHYILVKVRGIAKPYRPETKYTMVHANHTVLFLRGGILIAGILVLGFFFPSPTIEPITIQSIAQSDPLRIANTLLSEFDHTSDTATYWDTIDPYTYDTRFVYVTHPLLLYTQNTNISSGVDVFEKQDAATRINEFNDAKRYFADAKQFDMQSKNIIIASVSMLVKMAQSGLYESYLQSIHPYDKTYVTRFLSDTGVLEKQAQNLHMTTDQYGMLREEKGIIPLGAWWLKPLGILDHTVLANDQNQDRDGAEILGICFLLFMTFPYIPFVNRIPEFLHINTLIWKEKQNGK